MGGISRSVGNIAPDELPISQHLKRDLADWAAANDATLNRDDPLASGFPDDRAEAEFKKIGHELSERLKSELGDTYTVILKIL